MILNENSNDYHFEGVQELDGLEGLYKEMVAKLTPVHSLYRK